MEQSFDIDSRSLRSLEWDRLLAYLSAEAHSEWGKELCLELQGSNDPVEVAKLLDETDEALTIIRNRAALMSDIVPDLRDILGSVQAQGRLIPADLLAIKSMLTTAKSVKGSLSLLPDESFPRLRSYAEMIFPVEALRSEIDRCVDEQGGIKDDASPELRGLRTSVRKLHGDIRTTLNRMIHSAALSKALQEPIFTQRGGRYVLPVDVAHRGTVDGIVHDASQSGLTAYVEPLSVVEPTNKIRIKEAEIEREIERITAELCKLAYQHIDALISSFETLTALDVILAKARLALKYKGIRPELSEDGSLVLNAAKHPLLLLQNEREVVPSDVRLGGDERTLVITGPNTGGKTVLLKQLGLVALMVRTGLLISAKIASKVPIFKKVWADIGDEQSLTQSLSTFSSHMQNIVEVVDTAGGDMLILLDEIGVGTDPKEGAALARAVLEHLNRSGAITVTTTHYGELKMLAYSEPGFVNGSLEFDETTLSPTYRLRLGVAGSSKGTAIALRLGLNSEVVERAHSLLAGREEELSQAMAELERRTQLVNDREALLLREEEKFNVKKGEFDKSSEELLAELEAQRVEYASELETRYSEAMKQIRDMTKELQASPSLKNAQEAREKLEVIKKDLGWMEPVKKREQSSEPIKEGQEVKVLSLNQIGFVESLASGDGGHAQATVRLGNMRVKVAVEELRPYQRQVQKQRKLPGQRPRGNMKKSETRVVKASDKSLDAFIRTSSNTIDLRGERVDAALSKVERFLDTLSVEGISPAMIIHGHGTGAVKSAVRDFLRSCRYIADFKPGELYEGGDGVTIVTL
ncbi:endonuclease MutS2 [Candidatus Obscuribacterales bacterium]|nr:endonuclease MutS2 [Candidatus Obscuribacterales bacterium]